jgi:hypothetical protein
MSFLRKLRRGYSTRSSTASSMTLDQLACDASVLEAEPTGSAVPGGAWDRIRCRSHRVGPRPKRASTPSAAMHDQLDSASP